MWFKALRVAWVVYSGGEQAVRLVGVGGIALNKGVLLVRKVWGMAANPADERAST